MPRTNHKLIKERRDELGMSQSDLAHEASLGLRTIQNAESGAHNVRPKNLHRIAETLGLDYEDVVHPDEVASVDAFARWPWSLSNFIQDQVFPADHAFCRSDQEAKFATKAMREGWGDHLVRAESVGDTTDACAASKTLDAIHQRNELRYHSIWRANPNTMIFSTAGEERAGVCIVLPVTDRAYEALRNGEIAYTQIEAEDILPNSQNLILDSASEIATESVTPWYRITDSLSFALFFQIAALSIDVMAPSFRMLGFGASPLNLKRLRDIGFLELGIKMPEYGFSVCEFSSSDELSKTGGDSQNEEAYKRSTTTAHYSNLFKRFHLPSSLDLKRSMIRRALKLYGPAAKRRYDRKHDQDSRSAA